MLITQDSVDLANQKVVDGEIGLPRGICRVRFGNGTNDIESCGVVFQCGREFVLGPQYIADLTVRDAEVALPYGVMGICLG